MWLIPDLVIFHNVVTLTKVIRALVAEGYPVSLPALAALSPYQIGHVNRYGAPRSARRERFHQREPCEEYTVWLEGHAA